MKPILKTTLLAVLCLILGLNLLSPLLFLQMTVPPGIFPVRIW